jgi:hypothetical protein
MVAAARAVIVVVSITSENESMKRSFCCMLFLRDFGASRSARAATNLEKTKKANND